LVGLAGHFIFKAYVTSQQDADNIAQIYDSGNIDGVPTEIVKDEIKPLPLLALTGDDYVDKFSYLSYSGPERHHLREGLSFGTHEDDQRNQRTAVYIGTVGPIVRHTTNNTSGFLASAHVILLPKLGPIQFINSPPGTSQGGSDDVIHPHKDLRRRVWTTGQQAAISQTEGRYYDCAFVPTEPAVQLNTTHMLPVKWPVELSDFKLENGDWQMRRAGRKLTEYVGMLLIVVGGKTGPVFGFVQSSASHFFFEGFRLRSGHFTIKYSDEFRVCVRGDSGGAVVAVDIKDRRLDIIANLRAGDNDEGIAAQIPWDDFHVALA